MPCYSTVTETKLFDIDRIKRILEAQGGKVETDGSLWIRSGGIVLQRNKPDQAFQSVGSDQKHVALNRGYAEAGIRSFAQRRGYTIDKQNNRMVLTNRRGR